MIFYANETLLEKTTVIVTVSFLNELGGSLIPKANTIKWSLFGLDNRIVNARKDIAIDSAATINIVLTENDLSFLDGEVTTAKRWLKIDYRYDSTYGDALLDSVIYIFSLVSGLDK